MKQIEAPAWNQVYTVSKAWWTLALIGCYPPCMQTAVSVVQEQVEADEDTSIQQRVLMSTGTALGGAGDIIGEENEIAGGEGDGKRRTNFERRAKVHLQIEIFEWYYSNQTTLTSSI